MPPNASPKTHTSRPQPTLAAPARRDHRPRDAASSQSPSPSWIQTTAEAAWMGWLDQMVAPLFTRWRTHAGDDAALGWTTLGRESERHGRLQLEEAVEDPEAPEPDADDPAGRGLGTADPGRTGNARLPVCVEPAVLHRPDDVEGQEAPEHDRRHDEQLVEERRAERRDDQGVPGLQRAAHARHCSAVPSVRCGIVHRGRHYRRPCHDEPRGRTRALSPTA